MRKPMTMIKAVRIIMMMRRLFDEDDGNSISD
jgi:hypothetical protein